MRTTLALALWILGTSSGCKSLDSPTSRTASKNCKSGGDCNLDTSVNQLGKASDPEKGENDPVPTPTPTEEVTAAPQESPTATPTMMPTPTPTNLVNVPPPTPTPLPAPLRCSRATIHYVGTTGRCQPNAAAFAADDNRDTVLACCPLPASDILDSSQPSVRDAECAASEIVVGASSGRLVCAKINTSLYTLAPATTTCYFGKGASGGSGVKKCSAPSEIEMALVSSFGSDACLPSPYGGLITKRKSKYCRDVSGAVLQYRSSGQRVPMFQ